MRFIKNFIKKICPVPVLLFLERMRVLVQGMIIRVKILLHMPIKKKPSKLRFEIHLAEHCNLNCKACNNFSPIAEPELVDVDEFKRDFERLGSLFSGECERIYLLGGEPLLHPEIITLMKISRANFVKGDIDVFTNGILLTKMSPDFWKTCHDTNIGIIVSAYPINLTIDEIKALASNAGVKIQWAWGQSSQDRDLFVIRPIDVSGKQNAKVNFGICPRSVNCVMLSHGKLCSCSLVPNIYHFNKFFGESIPVLKENYIDIYEDLTSDEILSRLAEPIPACKYCSFNSKIIKWGISRKELTEWA